MNEKSLYGITTLYEPINTDQGLTVFDLVAVHGLNGHPLTTWTHKHTNTLWLRDLLPHEFPNIRIMTYGYNARFCNFTAHQDLRNIASKLLTELVDVRRKEQEMNRPIIFVCHSLGGIVVKKALLLGCPKDQERVQKSVYGLFFLGTPHHGSSIANCAKIVAKIVKACSPLNPVTSILGVLQRDSQVLFDIMEDFVGKTETLRIVSFFETKMTTFGPIKRMVVEHHSAKLNVPNEVTIGQNADHRELARFSSAHDRNFRPVLTTLDDFRRGIVGNAKPPLEHVELAHQELRPHSIFDVTIPLSDLFRGREEVLSEMELYFHCTTLAPPTYQRRFALCGLGGSGKTQVALQFAHRHRSKYKTGVFFLNASSREALLNSFDRIIEILELGSNFNKVEATKRWLSREEHSDWLLIFDNADDIGSVKLSEYYPAASWGHILITSRDQAAIGAAAKEGCVLEPLKVNEATSLFLERSGIRNPTTKDYLEAQKVVELLGCLPLAVDQGGAYLKSSQRNLREYSRLYHKRQQELLEFKPRLAHYEKTVLTAWELNFQQVAQESKPASDLLLLFCFLEPSQILETMLHRGCSPQRRWGPDGEIIEIAPEDAGLDLDVVALITNEIAFDAAVDKLLSFSLIKIATDANGFRTFSLHPLVQYCASQRVPKVVQDGWRAQALLLVCHAFPRNKYLEPEYGNLGRSQLPHINRTLQEYERITDKSSLGAEAAVEISSMLLAASRFSTLSWKKEAVDRAKILLQDSINCYMKAWVAHRESSLLRMTGDLIGSNLVLEKFVHATILPGHDLGLEKNSRWNCIRGDLVVSFAENLIEEDRLDAARSELCEWNPLDAASPSAMEQIVLRSKNITLGRILRFEGRFEDALRYLEEVLRKSEDDEFYEGTGWRRVLLSNIAELLCEVDRPAEAERLLMPELLGMIAGGVQNISSGRRLQLSLIESFIRRGTYDKALEYLLKLKTVYDEIDKPDSLAKRGMFRVITSLARIYHLKGLWHEALDAWQRSLKTLELLEGEDVNLSAILRFSISDAFFELRRYNESSENFRKGRVLLDGHKDKRRFWIVGFHSYWQDFIIQSIETKIQGVTAFLK